MNARLLTITDEDINLPHLHRDAEQNIPQELQSIQQWITWKYGPPDPTTGKCRKLPIGRDGTGSAWQKAPQWMSFDEAIGKAQSRGNNGVGLVLPAVLPDGSYVVGLDHDNVNLDDDNHGCLKSKHFTIGSASLTSKRPPAAKACACWWRAKCQSHRLAPAQTHWVVLMSFSVAAVSG